MMKTGFDNEKYLKIQSEHIRDRIAQFDGKLYMELASITGRRSATTSSSS